MSSLKRYADSPLSSPEPPKNSYLPFDDPRRIIHNESDDGSFNGNVGSGSDSAVSVDGDSSDDDAASGSLVLGTSNSPTFNFPILGTSDSPVPGASNSSVAEPPSSKRKSSYGRNCARRGSKFCRISAPDRPSHKGSLSTSPLCDQSFSGLPDLPSGSDQDNCYEDDDSDKEQDDDVPFYPGAPSFPGPNAQCQQDSHGPLDEQVQEGSGDREGSEEQDRLKTTVNDALKSLQRHMAVSEEVLSIYRQRFLESKDWSERNNYLSESKLLEERIEQKATALGYFKFTKVSSAHLGSVNDTWKRFIETVESVDRRKELKQDWDQHKQERRDYWNSKKIEEEAAAEQRGYLKTVSTAVMCDKTRTVAVLDKRYQDLLQEELHRDSTFLNSRDSSKSDYTCSVDGEIVSTIDVQRAPKRRRGNSAYDEALKLFEDSPLFDFFAYIFNKAQGIKPNPLPGVPFAVESPNIRRLAVYAHNELCKANITEQELKNVYLALSCIVSPHIPDASAVFGMELLRRIKEEVILETFESSRLEGILSPLRNAFEERLDVKYLMEEVSLRDADIVRRERDGEKADEEMLELEKKTLEIIRYLQFDQKLSETTCVSFWNHVWIILFGGTDIFFDMGELASTATKTDMQAIEVLFGTLSQTGGRKTDTLVRVQQVTTGVTSMLECAVNEHKPMHASSAALSHQSSKLLRINRSILGHIGFKETIVFVDAHGLTGMVHGMKAMEDVFGTQSLGAIALPTNKYELQDFLQGDSLTLLFRYR
ncbi:hypothetical protein BGX33_000596, partial [Mortierella sp. NVP41]